MIQSDLDAIRTWHYESRGFCDACHQPWPCPDIRLADALARLAEAEAVVEAARERVAIQSRLREQNPRESTSLFALLDAADDVLRDALAAHDSGADRSTEEKAHPGEPHEFRTVCQRCGENGYLHVAVITDLEVVRIEDRVAPDTEAKP